MLYYDKVPSDAELEAHEPLNPLTVCKSSSPRIRLSESYSRQRFLLRSQIVCVCVAYALIGALTDF